MPTRRTASPPSVLVVGGGGREHALCHALARSPHRPHLLCAPGNAGTATLARNVAVPADDVDGLVALATGERVDLVVVGPEAPLVLGLADRLERAGIPVVGPSAAAARLEGSKAFAKSFMARHGIPTAASRTFAREAMDAALAYVAAGPLPVVLKADGLAAGKGVIVATTRDEAAEGLRTLFLDPSFDAAAGQVVVEAFLAGEEASVFALSDGRDFVLLPAAQDHKRAFDGDRGPNTGGMGAYAPAPLVTPTVLDRVARTIVRPTLDGMAAEGTPYRGVLFVGLMINDRGDPSVVEFNCRLGDPETQAVLPLLDTDLFDLFFALIEGRLAGQAVRVRSGAAACVVLASEGYPGAYRKGLPVELGPVPDDALVFHAGTEERDGRVVTTGGRVFGVTGLGPDLPSALATAYAAVDAVRFEGKMFRRDIGRRGLR